MNNIASNFDQILDFAKSYGLPLAKKRAILQEYLQVKILDMIYREKISKHLYFVGGTSLRLLRGLDRFSEDLDFDYDQYSQKDIGLLIESTYLDLKKQNIEIDLYKNITEKRSYFEYRFPKLLFDLRLSLHKDEKLAIKFDFESHWKHKKNQVIMLNRYGFLIQVVSVELNTLLVQKVVAYLQRPQTQARDLYDIIWLVAQGAKLDFDFIRTNKLPANLVEQAKAKFKGEKSILKNLKLRLRPFLVEDKNADKLDLFSEVLQRVSTKD